MGFSPKNYYNHFKGKENQPMSDLEQKLFTKFKKKKPNTQLISLSLLNRKKALRYPDLMTTCKQASQVRLPNPNSTEDGTVKFNNPEPGTRQFKREISGAIGVFVVFLADCEKQTLSPLTQRIQQILSLYTRTK